MYQLQIRKLAKKDIQDIVDYYDENASTFVTDRFLENLFTEFEYIKSKPKSFQVKFKNTRVSYLKSFSFGIHYRIKENSKIEILAILHTSRSPKTWKKR